MSDMSGSEQSPPRRPGAAVRLIFSYDGDEVRLLSQQRVEMTLPPGDPLQAPSGVHGFWAEVRGVNGEVLYRWRMPDPLRADTEIFSEDPERTVSRTAIERPQGAFTVVVPDYAEAAWLHDPASNDLLIPLAPSPKDITANHAYSVDELLGILADRANQIPHMEPDDTRGG
jgi:hypothetical protein